MTKVRPARYHRDKQSPVTASAPQAGKRGTNIGKITHELRMIGQAVNQRGDDPLGIGKARDVTQAACLEQIENLSLNK